MKQSPANKADHLANLELYRGIAALETGHLEKAFEQVNAMKAQLLQVTRTSEADFRYMFTMFRGDVLLAQGKADSAITICRQAVASRSHSMGAPTLAAYTICSFYASLGDVLARAYLKKGQIPEAITEYERLSTFNPRQDDRRLISSEYHYSLAKLYQQVGSKEKAISEYNKLLHIWKNADPDIPELIDAKKQLAKLTALMNK